MHDYPDVESHQDFESVKTRLGSEIRRRRLEIGLSQEAFAANLGVHRTYLGAVERGEVNLSLQKLFVLTLAFKCEFSELFAPIDNAHESQAGEAS